VTLVLNEIILRQGLIDTYQIIAADRRISRQGKYAATRRKLFTIPLLNATISYFGIASFFKKNKEVYLSDLLPDFINHSTETAKDIPTFASQLREHLHDNIPCQDLRTKFSGFHISTYINGLPDFWYMSNIKTLDGFSYRDPASIYDNPSSHFLQRDAIDHFGWNGRDQDTTKSGVWYYRNGDFRVHALTSNEIDRFMENIFQFPDFRPPRKPEEYADYVHFKFEILSYIYKRWAKQKIVSRPIDVIIMTRDGLKEHKKK